MTVADESAESDRIAEEAARQHDEVDIVGIVIRWREKNAIVEDLATRNPWHKIAGAMFCFFCAVRDSNRSYEAHQIDCLWLRARKAVKAGGSDA